ncbi:putative actin interacting protein 3 [Erysiphe neolycopersici]|uniref:Putative actin interacting protein 3 n=1 Tax=Erysiphe neolycopersici TaxID=212602 RepID=A0A420I3R1_9PEZI|nr:putative actin interacting protein 3 [Erysiphe neolycopersici]
MISFLLAFLKSKLQTPSGSSLNDENYVDSAKPTSQRKVSISSKVSNSSNSKNFLPNQTKSNSQTILKPASQPCPQATPQSISRSILQIEKSVKIISIVIKQLLELLNRWSQREVSFARVSEIQVCLENELDITYEVFAAINIETSDLEHYAELLRTALKKTLSQEASIEGFDNILLQIRYLTNYLLLGLKCKKEKLHHNLLGDIKDDKSIPGNNCTKSSFITSLGPFKIDDFLVKDDIQRDKEYRASCITNHVVLNDNISSSFLGSEQTLPDQVSPAPTKKENFSSPPPPPPPPLSSKNAFAALERRGILKRRALRTHSSDQICKYLCVSPKFTRNTGFQSYEFKNASALNKKNQFLLSPSLPPKELSSLKPYLDSPTFPQNTGIQSYKIDNTSSLNSKNQKISGPILTPPPLNDLILFLHYKKNVKKFLLSGGYSNLSMERLQLAFIEKFALNIHHNDADLPAIYIQDPVSSIRYELEDLNDIKDRSLLFLNVGAPNQGKCQKDEGLSDIKKMMEDIKTLADKQQVSIQQISDRQQHIAKELCQIQTTVSSISRDINHRAAQNCTTSGPYSINILGQKEELEGIYRDLANLRQSYSSYQSEIQNSLNSVRKVSKNFQKVAAEVYLPDTINDYGRKYVDDKKQSINKECEKLVVNVDDLLNAVKELRLDVAVRGVDPLPRKLQTVSKDMAVAEVKLKKLKEIINGENLIWNKTWDKEIQRVRDDRENMRIYQGLVDELQDDVTKASRILSLVKSVPKVQIKISHVPVVPHHEDKHDF